MIQYGFFALLIGLLFNPDALSTPYLERHIHSKPRSLNETFTFNDENVSHTPEVLKGKVVLVNFWATWCSPCITEMPAILSLKKMFPTMKILLVSIDRNQSQAQSFLNSLLKDHPYLDQSILYFNQMRDLMHMDIKALPVTLLIDKEGNERARVEGSMDWRHPDVIKYLRALHEL